MQRDFPRQAYLRGGPAGCLEDKPPDEKLQEAVIGTLRPLALKTAQFSVRKLGLSYKTHSVGGPVTKNRQCQLQGPQLLISEDPCRHRKNDRLRHP